MFSEASAKSAALSLIHFLQKNSEEAPCHCENVYRGAA
jgi:hypothetical protein